MRVLVPVEILEGETVSSGLVELLGTMDVTVLGYHELPEQTPTDQARLQYEDRASEALQELVMEFREAGSEATYRLVFTHDSEKTIDRVARETDARAFVLTGTSRSIERLLVPLSGDVSVDRILEFLEALIDDRQIAVTLFRASKPDSEGEDRSVLEEAAKRLTAAGIETRTELASGAPFDALIDAVEGHDAIVMGEKAPSLKSFWLGDEAERIAAASVGPVVVVRYDRPADG